MPSLRLLDTPPLAVPELAVPLSDVAELDAGPSLDVFALLGPWWSAQFVGRFLRPLFLNCADADGYPVAIGVPGLLCSAGVWIAFFFMPRLGTIGVGPK